MCQYPFVHLGGERHCESKVSCPRTQHNVSGQGKTKAGTNDKNQTNCNGLCFDFFQGAQE